MRILLTGATGLIGQAVRRKLADRHQVITLGRTEAADIRADLSDPATIQAADISEIDALIHCAGVVDEDFRDAPERALHMAVFGADALAQRAVQAGASRLAYVSSAHVYGPMVGAVDERSPINPVSDYAIAHFATDQVFRRRTGPGVATLSLRPCAVFGDLESASTFRRWSLIPFSFPRDATRDHAIVIRSTGEQRRNFVGSEDIAGSIAAWLDADAEGWRAVNPLGSTSMSVHDFALLCARISEEITGAPCTVSRVSPDGRTAGDDFDYRSVTPLAAPEQSIEAFVRRLCLSLVTETA